MKIYFSKHVLKRMKERVITVNEVVECINNGDYFFEGTKGKKVKYCCVYKDIRVIIYETVKGNNNIEILTVIPSKLKKIELRRRKRKEKLTIKHILLNEKGITNKQIIDEIKDLNLYKKPLIV